MDDEYKKIYAAMLRGAPHLPFYQPFFFGSDDLYRQVFEIVERNCERSIPVREDARLFLTINLYHMIALPIAIRYQRHDSQDGPLVEILNLLNSDCKVIVGMAVDEAKKYGENEVSGHSMLTACSRAYEKLKVAASKVWG